MDRWSYKTRNKISRFLFSTSVRPLFWRITHLCCVICQMLKPSTLKEQRYLEIYILRLQLILITVHMYYFFVEKLRHCPVCGIAAKFLSYSDVFPYFETCPYIKGHYSYIISCTNPLWNFCYSRTAYDVYFTRTAYDVYFNESLLTLLPLKCI